MPMVEIGILEQDHCEKNWMCHIFLRITFAPRNREYGRYIPRLRVGTWKGGNVNVLELLHLLQCPENSVAATSAHQQLKPQPSHLTNVASPSQVYY